MPYFLSAAIMINLGGTSTLIGSVSNMIIGIQAGLGFNDFIVYLTPAEILLWLLTILALYYFFRSRLGEEKTPPVYDPWEGVEDKRLFWRSTAIMALFLSLFIVSDWVGVGPEGVALGCAILALVASESIRPRSSSVSTGKRFSLWLVSSS